MSFAGETTLIKVDSFEVSPTRFLIAALTNTNDQSSMTIIGVLNSKLYVLAQQEIGQPESIATDCIISPRGEFLVVTYTGKLASKFNYK